MARPQFIYLVKSNPHESYIEPEVIIVGTDAYEIEREMDKDKWSKAAYCLWQQQNGVRDEGEKIPWPSETPNTNTVLDMI